MLKRIVVKSAQNWEFFGSKEGFDQHLRPILNRLDTAQIDAFDELIVRINIQLLWDLSQGHIQFEHIQPLLKRVESAVNDIRKIFSVKENINDEFKLLNVVSLRGCNQATKKIVPLLLAKMFYQEHRDNVDTPPQNTLHFIIDEAHNILSQHKPNNVSSRLLMICYTPLKWLTQPESYLALDVVRS